MNFTPDTKSGTDTNTHVASSARRNGRFANNGQAGTCARGVNRHALTQKASGKRLVVYLGKRNDIARDGSIQRKDSTTHTKRP